MDISSSPVGFPTYSSTLDDGLCGSDFGQDMQPDSEISYTQPVARMPIGQQCGDTGQDGSMLGGVGQAVDNNFSWFGDDADGDSAQPL
jgi:hypothetical protein